MNKLYKKILTISVAAYNVEKYLDETLNSLIVPQIMEDIEVIVVDDGSCDRTEEIARIYAERYPGTIRLISKGNGGYGSTINASIQIAKGKYFKQLDGDDWFERDNMQGFVEYLKTNNFDCVYTPFWKMFQQSGSKELVMKSKKSNKNCLCSEDIHMHALTFKTKVLVDNKIKITENCYYTDCEYNLKSLVFAKTIGFYGKGIYCYRLEESGQSVSLEGWKKHYKEHKIVIKELINWYYQCEENIENDQKKHVKEYIIMIIKTNFIVVLELKNKEIWNDFIQFDRELKKQYLDFYFVANTNLKLQIVRLSGYRCYKLAEWYHKLFEG